MRGYGEDSLGPRDVNGLPSGGDRLMILNQEARFPMYRWANGVVFVDAGNIFAKGEVDWSGLKMGVRFWSALRYAGGIDPRRCRVPAIDTQDGRSTKSGSTSASGTSSNQASTGQQVGNACYMRPTAQPLRRLAYLIVRRIASTADRSGASGARRRNASKCSAVFDNWRWR